jgi:2-polyprenyl-3-methyl-5-hydroxy-6-metoxy-1,4-benzoquinol methylase
VTTEIKSRSEAASERRDALSARIFQATLGCIDVFSIYLGDRLCLYRTLADGGPATSAELAERTGTTERYVREWLEQQAVAGLLEVDDASASAAERRYAIPPGHDEVLLDPESLTCGPALARIVAGTAGHVPEILQAFRTGGGVPYSQYGADAREGQAGGNRPSFVNFLGTTWLPAIPDVHERLLADPAARVADVGCGAGWSSIAIARAYPKVRVTGFDVDEPSIALARANAIGAGVADRVNFVTRDVADLDVSDRFELVTAFEAVHELARPVEALHRMRGITAEGGVVIVADERVAEEFTVPGDDIERLMYGSSVLFCLPQQLAEQPSAGTGTVMRPSTLRQYALSAGFHDLAILPIEDTLWRFYRLLP